MLGKSPSAFLMTPEGRPLRSNSASTDGDVTSERERKKGQRTHPHVPTCTSGAAADALFLPPSDSGCACPVFACETTRRAHNFIRSHDGYLLLVGAEAANLVLRQKYECLCALKNSGDSLDVGQESPLVKRGLQRSRLPFKYAANTAVLHIL